MSRQTTNRKPGPVFIDEMDRGALANNTGIGRMFLVWRRSVYKVVYREVLVFLFLFGTLSAIYRNALDEEQKRDFEESRTFFKKYTHALSVPFLLGFYVTTVAERWWMQYLTVPWPDRLMLAVRMYVKGDSAKAKLIRKVLLRRALLMMALLLRSISLAVRKKYPTLQSLVEDGILTHTEQQCFESIAPVVNLFWVPASWFVTALQEAIKDGILDNEEGRKLIMEEFLDFRASCGAVWSYNWVNIPIIYSQVCTLATYSYFLACVMARQYTGPSDWTVEAIDIYFPIGTVIEMLCYIGLLKVAEEIKNPFGDNDEDFDLNYLITRHLHALRIGSEETDSSLTSYTDDSVIAISTPSQGSSPRNDNLPEFTVTPVQQIESKIMRPKFT